MASFPKKIILVVVSWLLASLTAYVLASVFHSSSVLARLQALGFSIPMQERVSMTMYDLKGLVAYLAVIGIGFAIAFTVFGFLNIWLSSRRWLFYGIAGVLALATVLLSMNMVFSMTPIAGARGFVGFALQLFAGGVGGVVYGLCLSRTARSTRS